MNQQTPNGAPALDSLSPLDSLIKKYDLSQHFPSSETLRAFQAAYAVVHRLRAPGGCPWDQKQTHQSLRKHLIEEAYETLEVLDQIHSTDDLKRPEIESAFAEEWGDVLLQILLHFEIAKETSPSLDFGATCRALAQKLIRRHPHVFGDTPLETAEQVIDQWAQIKKAEKTLSGTTAPAEPSVLDSVKPNRPALDRTLQTIQAVTQVGFQWPTLDGPLDKLQEEMNELIIAIRQKDTDPDAVDDELGDVLFSLCNIMWFLKRDPETVLRKNLLKFHRRFKGIENLARIDHKNLKDLSLEQMDAYWNQIKSKEKLKKGDL